MFIVGFGSLSFGLVFEHFHNRARVIRIMALLLAAYTFLTANSPCIMPGQIKDFLGMPARERTLSKHKPFNIDSKVHQEYGYWIWIENNIMRGDTLVYTFEAFTLDASKPFFTGGSIGMISPAISRQETMAPASFFRSCRLKKPII